MTPASPRKGRGKAAGKAKPASKKKRARKSGGKKRKGIGGDSKKNKKQRVAQDGHVLDGPDVWFHQEVADGLWAPDDVRDSTAVPAIFKSLQDSWFRVTHCVDTDPPDWDPKICDFVVEPPKPRKKKARSLKEVKAPVMLPPIMSCTKVALKPSAEQKTKLNQMFATRRAVFNKLVAASKEECATRLAQRCIKPKALAQQYRSMSTKEGVRQHFRNKKKLASHLQCNSEVFVGAFDDFQDAVVSSAALFDALKEKGKKTTFPVIGFKSVFARSDAMAPRTDRYFFVSKDRKSVRFHEKFMGKKWIELSDPLPEITTMVRLVRTRDKGFYLCVPTCKDFAPTLSTRTGAIDPGVRCFIILYDPSGRVFSIADPDEKILTRLKIADALRRELALLEQKIVEPPCRGKDCACKRTSEGREAAKNEECKCRHPCHTKTKVAKKKTAADCVVITELQGNKRRRQRLRQQIRQILGKVTCMVYDMHQKVSKWLLLNYHEVMLPTFETQQMAARYVREERLGITTKSLLAPVEELVLRGRKRKLRRPTVRAMMTLSHYKFKKMLEYKMQRTSGRMVEVHEEYTSKTCSGCGRIDKKLGANKVYRCKHCDLVQDRDVDAARDIFHKNVGVSVLRDHFTGVPTSGSPVSSALA